MSEYTLVSWSYYNGKGLFSQKNDKEVLTKVYMLSEQAEDILETGRIVRLNTFKGRNDPYFKLEKVEGFTTRARKYGELKSKMTEEFPELESRLSGMNSNIAPYGEYIYINLPHLDNYVNPLTKDTETFLNENIIFKEKFNAELLKKIVEYQPQALMGGVIKSYREKNIPEFLWDLKFSYPQLFSELLSISEVARDISDKITSVGKKAYVHTLDKGKVSFKTISLKSYIFEWDGRVLTNLTTLEDGNVLVQKIEPNKDTIVEIISDETVTRNTRFSD